MSPSHRCRVTGLRPTYGRVSRYGAMGLSYTMDKVGPICREVEPPLEAKTKDGHLAACHFSNEVGDLVRTGSVQGFGTV